MATASGQTRLPSRQRVYLLAAEAFHGPRSSADGLLALRAGKEHRPGRQGPLTPAETRSGDHSAAE